MRLHLLGLLLVDLLAGALDQRHHVAHAQDARRQAVGIERLQRVELLARAHELDRHARDLAHGKRRATTRVAIHLGQDQAGQPDRLVELVGDTHRVLAGHRVHHQQDFLRLRALADGGDLAHQVFVDVQAASGIEDEHGQRLLARPFEAALGDIYRLIARWLGIDGDIELLANLLQLLHGGGPLHVGGDHARLLAVLAEPVGQLGRLGGLAGALQADEHEDGGRRSSELDLRRCRPPRRRASATSSSWTMPKTCCAAETPLSTSCRRPPWRVPARARRTA